MAKTWLDKISTKAKGVTALLVLLSLCTGSVISVSATYSKADSANEGAQQINRLLMGDLADPNAPGLLETIRADSKEIALIKKDLDELRVESKTQHQLVLSAISKIQRP